MGGALPAHRMSAICGVIESLGLPDVLCLQVRLLSPCVPSRLLARVTAVAEGSLESQGFAGGPAGDPRSAMEGNMVAGVRLEQGSCKAQSRGGCRVLHSARPEALKLQQCWRLCAQGVPQHCDAYVIQTDSLVTERKVQPCRG